MNRSASLHIYDFATTPYDGDARQAHQLIPFIQAKLGAAKLSYILIPRSKARTSPGHPGITTHRGHRQHCPTISSQTRQLRSPFVAPLPTPCAHHSSRRHPDGRRKGCSNRRAPDSRTTNPSDSTPIAIHHLDGNPTQQESRNGPTFRSIRRRSTPTHPDLSFYKDPQQMCIRPPRSSTHFAPQASGNLALAPTPKSLRSSNNQRNQEGHECPPGDYELRRSRNNDRSAESTSGRVDHTQATTE